MGKYDDVAQRQQRQDTHGPAPSPFRPALAAEDSHG